MKRQEIIFLTTIFLIVIGFFLFFWLRPNNSGDMVNIYLKGDIYITINLETKEVSPLYQDKYPRLYDKAIDVEYSYDVPDEHIVIVMVGDYKVNGNDTKMLIEVSFSQKAVRILYDQTPNQIGVKRSWYDGTNLPVISAPNNVYIMFSTAKSDEVDGTV